MSVRWFDTSTRGTLPARLAGWGASETSGAEPQKDLRYVLRHSAAHKALRKKLIFAKTKIAQPRGKRASQSVPAIGPALAVWPLFEMGLKLVLIKTGPSDILVLEIYKGGSKMNYKNQITKEKMKVLKVRVDRDMKYEIEYIALREGISMAEVVRRIVEEWMENDRRQ